LIKSFHETEQTTILDNVSSKQTLSKRWRATQATTNANAAATAASANQT